MNDTPPTKPVDTAALLRALAQLSVDLEAARVAIMHLAAEQRGNMALLGRLAALEEALRKAEFSTKRHAIPIIMEADQDHEVERDTDAQRRAGP